MNLLLWEEAKRAKAAEALEAVRHTQEAVAVPDDAEEPVTAPEAIEDAPEAETEVNAEVDADEYQQEALDGF